MANEETIKYDAKRDIKLLIGTICYSIVRSFIFRILIIEIIIP